MMPESVQLTAFAVVAKIIDGFTVVLNRGAEHGVKIGDRFLIYGIGDEITDPETGESLGCLEIVKGIGSVSHVQEKICTVRSVKTKSPTPTIKTTKRNPKGGSAFGLTFGSIFEETVEERKGELIDVPFEQIETGDRARPL